VGVQPKLRLLLFGFVLVSCGGRSARAKLPPEDLANLAKTRQSVPSQLRVFAALIDKAADTVMCHSAEHEIYNLQQISRHAREVAADYEKIQTADNEEKAIYALHRMADSFKVNVLLSPCISEATRYEYDKVGGLAGRTADIWQELFGLAPLDTP
jgi:hypothetical protein